MTDWLRMPTITPSLPLGLAAAATIVGAGVVVLKLPSIASAVAAPFASTDEEDPLGKYLKEHDELVELSRKRVEGRYVFFAPPAPKPPKPPPPKDDGPPKPPPPPPILPAPATYEGPKPRGLLGDIVFFDDSKVKVGDKHGDIEIVEANGPFSIKIAWTKSGHERGEYVVSTWGDMPKGFDVATSSPFSKTSSGFKTADAKGPDGKPVDGKLPAAKPGEESEGGPGGNPATMRRGVGPDGKPLDPKANPKNGTPGANGEGAQPGQPGEQGQPGSQPAEGAGAPPPQTQPANGEPAQPGRQPPAPGEPASETKPTDYVPLEKLPPFRTEQYLKNMSKTDAQSALNEINQALTLPNVDDHNRARLEHDASVLTERLRSDT